MQGQLSKNAVLFISAGFTDSYIMQVIAVKQNQSKRGLDMCLSDGAIYVGSIYIGENIPIIKKFSIVQITGQFVSADKPIVIKTLNLISNKVYRLIGSVPQTLHDYLKREGSQRMQNQQNTMIKKVKIDPNEKHQFMNIAKSIQTNFDTNNQKTRPYVSQSQGQISNNKNTQRIVGKNELVPQAKQIIKVLQISKAISKTEQVTHNILIRDLYERMIEWKILAKVNLIQKFKCSNGVEALSFILSDQNEDDIKCTYFPPLNSENQTIKIEQNCIYTFAGGDIKMKVTETDHITKQVLKKHIQITFNNEIVYIPRPNISFPFHPNNLLPLDQLLYKRNYLKEINVIAVLKQFTNHQPYFKDQKIKYFCIICDPNTNYQIELTINIDEKHRTIRKGAIYTFHNFLINSKDTQMRLYPSYKSYFKDQTQNTHQFFGPYKKSIENIIWNSVKYKNLSQPSYTKRTIVEMKQMVQQTQNCIFSEIECRIQEIKTQKFYQSCRHCLSPLCQKQQNLYFCGKCLKIVDYIPSCNLAITFSDSTGSFKTKIYSNLSEYILDCEAIKFQQMKVEERNKLLNLIKYTDFQLKIKTQIKDNILTITVIEVNRSQTISTLTRIRQITVQQKMRMKPKWQ